jgi:predicted secreted hydrolase
MAHLAVTDVAGQQFFAYERFNRDALGIAGAQAAPFKVWLDDWHVASTTPDVAQMQLRAAHGAVALDLQLDNRMPPVLQGNAGLSQKSAGVGNTSYYYSVPRMATTGTLTIAGQAYQVTGTSWMDREWSTSALAADQVGWDWFAVHLDDGSDVMLYHLRRRDGSIDPYSGGSWRDASGKVTPLRSADISLQPVGQWTSPHTGAQYPASWQMTITRLGLDVTVTPLLADQELPVTVRYWEGAVAVKGQRANQPIKGNGYLEMTGYADGGTRP